MERGEKPEVLRLGALPEAAALALEAHFGALATREVVLTAEREAHIALRHAEAALEVRLCARACVARPDLVLLDANHADTVWVVKTTDARGVKLVLRLALASDRSARKNSIMTAHLLSARKMRQMLRNQQVLYSRE